MPAGGWPPPIAREAVRVAALAGSVTDEPEVVVLPTVHEELIVDFGSDPTVSVTAPAKPLLGDTMST